MADASTQRPGLWKRLLGEQPPAKPSAREEKEQLVRKAARMLTQDPVHVLGYYEKFANSRTLQDLYRHHALLNTENAAAAFKALALYLDKNPEENVYGSFPLALMSQLGKRYPELADAYKDTQLMDAPVSTQPLREPKGVVIPPPPDNLNQKSGLTRVDTRGLGSRTLKPAPKFTKQSEADLHTELALPLQTETTIADAAAASPAVENDTRQPIAASRSVPAPKQDAPGNADLKEEGFYVSAEAGTGDAPKRRQPLPVTPWRVGNPSSERISLTEQILSNDTLSGIDETHGPTGASR